MESLKSPEKQIEEYQSVQAYFDNCMKWRKVEGKAKMQAENLAVQAREWAVKEIEEQSLRISESQGDLDGSFTGIENQYEQIQLLQYDLLK